MNENRRRSVITVLLAVGGAVFGVAGVGHAYLREWKRALLWFLLALFGGAALVVSAAGDTVPSSVFDLPPTVVAGIFFILFISVVDAYLVSIRKANATPSVSVPADLADGETPAAAADGEQSATVTCPHCGRETDPELDFCTWCTGKFADAEEEPET
ncbi:Membrane protein containing Zn-ribbon domain [Halalkaliarchaeum sp. AArc-CO]|uniref:zinc ribbon domain-containing protein n=1 Tax=unclassified Halalkaliarchaeum TaxID=2678344 RepID=UPI00217EBAB4|nr:MULTISPECIES: zinc ribbon domain-containing protein [unclassified Halalkaliarchaeum]MDR5672119.1 zinc ribbon domain-containing protein [Halalkaliarchaeum sp. AArc-GB]UWG51624.1 Membrane protein containing Zn-ribbon domain [Halalkaliarchaeum sp. AArc-CO]